MPTLPQTITGLIALILVSGCNSPESDMTDQNLKDDLEAIDELHRRDKEASLSGDNEALLALWSDDPAVLPPRGEILKGRDDLEGMMAQYEEARRVWETVEYEQDFFEVEVVGEFAWDWGTFNGRSRNRETGQEISSSGKLFRILKRSPDGSWRVHRSIWNVDESSSASSDP